MRKIRVLIVDDSSLMCRVIRDMIESDPEFEVVDTASNGKEAVEMNRQYSPDCLTLDVEMPIMNGIEALKIIMEEQPVPVVMLSSLTLEGKATTVEAMMLGAVDYIAKPHRSISLDFDPVKERLLSKLKLAVRAKLPTIDHKFNRFPLKDMWHRPTKGVSVIEKIVCIGSSTGGPRALQTVISNLPCDLPAPVLVVQHMPSGFTTTLATRLNQISKLNVKEAEEGEVLENGTVYIAPGGWQMTAVKRDGNLVVKLEDSPPIKGLKPCYDLLLESIARLEYPVIYAVLTGMGSDGSNGLKVIKEQTQVYAVAESETTSIIFGMPKAAIKSGLVDKVLDLKDIASAIIDQLHH